MGTLFLSVVVFYLVAGFVLTMYNNGIVNSPLLKRTKQLFFIPTLAVVGIIVWQFYTMFSILNAGVWSLSGHVLSLSFGLVFYVAIVSFGVYKRNSMSWVVRLSEWQPSLEKAK